MLDIKGIQFQQQKNEFSENKVSTQAEGRGEGGA